MRVLKESMENITNHVRFVAEELNDQQINKFINYLEQAKKVYIYGAGRSGLVAKAFAMRLMHLGIAVHVVGEITTPAIEAEDIFITISGSGETTSVVNSAKIAKNVGATVVAITSPWEAFRRDCPCSGQGDRPGLKGLSDTPDKG
jgi:3-hexulose-6-phosphate synthase/6-phospho-3-hexuloisomerase